MTKWTEQQRDAITDRGHSLIVCAAAGSGKTAVLTERITRLVAAGTPITEMLIVTFTKAAAAEMRGRIAEALRKAAGEAEGEDRAWLEEQCLLVGRAQISTLHSFCAALLRDHFEALDIDPVFRVADAAESAVLRAQAMEEALYACYEEDSPEFREADAWFGEEKLRKEAEALHRFAHAEPSPEAFYETARAAVTGSDEEILSGAAAQVLLRETERALRAMIQTAESADAEGVHESYRKALREEGEMLRGLLRAIPSGFSGFAAAVRAAAPGGALPWASPRAAGKGHDKALTARAKRLRDGIKSRADSALGFFLSGTPEEIAADVRATAAPLEGLIRLAETWGRLYGEAKRRRGVLDFDDLEREALRALTGESAAVREAAAQRYRYVFVDEYQDSSAIQEAILGAFANLGRADGLFQVGDVKQSIYRFRKAEPALFRNKAAEYARPERTDARRIDLNANFRSRANILRAANAVFRRIMRAEETEIEYDAREALVCGLGEREDDPPVELRLLPPGRRSSVREEAAVAAARMKALLGTPVYDPKEGTLRPARWRDMAVLMRKVSGQAAEFAEALTAAGIPVFCDAGEEYFELPEVRQMIALLQAVDNGEQDLPLLAALRGPAVGMTDAELSEIRIAAGEEAPFHEALRLAAEGEGPLAERARTALERLAFWRLCARHQSPDLLIRRILEESRLPLIAAALPDGAERMANLSLLEARARDFAENRGGSLHAFLAFVEHLRAGGDTQTARAIGEGEDVVRVMSVHKSKGLEFPIVLLCDMAARTSRPSPMDGLLADPELGAGLPRVDRELGTRRSTLIQTAAESVRRRKEVSEEIRILYVAMTRAQDRLILIGTPTKNAFERWEKLNGAPAECASELDMVCPALLSAGAGFQPGGETVTADGAVFSVVTEDRAEDDAPSAGARAADLLREMMAGEPDEAAAALLRFSPDTGRRVRKTSVTAVLRDGKYRGDDPEDERPAAQPILERPRFRTARGLNAAEIGTAFHRAACACDLAALRAAPDRAAEAARQWETLRARGVLNAAEAAAVPPGMLADWFASPLAERMLKSGTVRREWAFTRRRETEEGGQILQGVIDCCFVEDGRWILVDYKTDSAGDPAAVAARHRPQLMLYKEALTALTGMPVAECLLWLVRAGRACRV